MGMLIYWELCKELKFAKMNKWHSSWRMKHRPIDSQQKKRELFLLCGPAGPQSKKKKKELKER